MKPRLDGAPLTTEDDWCWYIVMCRKNGRCFGIRSFSVQTDRRDADLMFRAQRVRVETCVTGLALKVSVGLGEGTAPEDVEYQFIEVRGPSQWYELYEL
jgi:hypothetical protein